MLTLEEIIEAGNKENEKTVNLAIALDYGFILDKRDSSKKLDNIINLLFDQAFATLGGQTSAGNQITPPIQPIGQIPG